MTKLQALTPPSARSHPSGGAPRRHGVRIVAQASLPTRHGDFTALSFTGGDLPVEHLALQYGPVRRHRLLVRLHSECLTGDVLGSLRCDCGEQLDRALGAIRAAGSGMLIYLRGHEGRGIGLASKLRAYALQEQGMDTIEASLALGLPADARSYEPACGLLNQLGVRSVRLLSNNPDKQPALESAGIACTELVAMPATVTMHNDQYLRTKTERLGHRGLRALAGLGDHDD